MALNGLKNEVFINEENFHKVCHKNILKHSNIVNVDKLQLRNYIAETFPCSLQPAPPPDSHSRRCSWRTPPRSPPAPGG